MRRFLRGALLVVLAHPALAQDAHFSQFYETATLRNPALVGVFSGDYKVGVVHRNQWSSMGTPFVTTNLAAESRIMILKETNDFLSFGINAQLDKAGSINFSTNTFYGAVNYNKSLGRDQSTFLSVGLAGGYIQRSVDVSKMRFASQYSNGTFDQNNTASAAAISGNVVQHFDLGAGVSLNGSMGKRVNYYAGVAGYHLSRPQETYLSQEVANLHTRWTGNAGVSVAFNNTLSMILHANYQWQDPNSELVAGGLLRGTFGTTSIDNPTKKMALAAGCFYRAGDAIIPTVRLEFSKLAVTGSYDVPVTSNRIYTTGMNAFEISLFFRGNWPKRPDNPMACPRFEGLLMDEPKFDY
jgi:type IX secretion system PorP/SprF family membrane protein